MIEVSIMFTLKNEEKKNYELKLSKVMSVFKNANTKVFIEMLLNHVDHGFLK